MSANPVLPPRLDGRLALDPSPTGAEDGRHTRANMDGYASRKLIHELRMVTQNISGPSMARAERLLYFFEEVDADVLVLTETRPMPGTEFLLKTFRDSGYSVVTSPISRSERGVALVHRLADVTALLPHKVDLSHRVAVARMDAEPRLTVVGTYVPSRDASQPKITRKRLFLAQLTEFLSTLATREELILVGDLNVIHREHVPRYPAFRALEYDFLEGLRDHGLVDIFAQLHPGVQAYSWIGRTGDGYRYDYVFVSKSLASHVVDCEYLNEPREERISDHAGVLLTLKTHSEIRSVRLGADRQASLTG